MIGQYQYDGNNLKIKTTDATGKSRYSLYSGAGWLVGEYDPTKNESTEYAYLNGKQVGSTTYTVSNNQCTAPIKTSYHTDGSGSTVLASTATGAILWKEHYSPLGERQVKSSTSTKNSQYFHGKEQDTTTGLQYFGARWYDPMVGRFMAVDPVGVKEADPHSFNRYAFVNNNSYKYIDPDGRETVGLSPIWNSGNLIEAGPTGAWQRNSSPEVTLATVAGTAPKAGASAGAAGSELARTFDSMAHTTPCGVFCTQGYKGWWITGTSTLTRVGRWMSTAEYNTMLKAGRVVEGAGGSTSVALASAGSKSFGKQAGKGSVYVQFDVPGNSLIQGGQDEWFKLIGPNANTAMKRALDKQGGEMLPKASNISGILERK